MIKINRISNTKTFATLFAMVLSLKIFAQADTKAAAQIDGASSMFTDPTFMLISLAVILLLTVILALAKTSTGLSKLYGDMHKKMKLIAFLLLFSVPMLAQQAEKKQAFAPTQIPDWVFNPTVYLIGTLFFVMLLTVFVLYKVNMAVLNALSPQKQAEISTAEAGAIVLEKKPDWLRKIYLKMVDSVPVEKEKDVMLDHDYDGIRELDNNLPPWWKYGFYVTILWGIFYIIYFHVIDSGKLQAAEYAEEVSIAEVERVARMKASADNVTEDNVTILADASLIANGKETYTKFCAACHLASGGGTVGPNLTDEYWLHGGGIKNIFKVITNGVPSKGMIAWKAQLSPKKIQEVASYILTLQGTKPADAKEPQGEVWVEQTTVAADSTNADLTLVVLSDSTTVLK